LIREVGGAAVSDRYVQAMKVLRESQFGKKFSKVAERTDAWIG
jgi:hypothetical protein